jgi:phage-related protein
MAATAIWAQVTAAAAATGAWLKNTAATIANTAANVAARVALGVWRTAVAVATAAQWAWNIAMSANPIGLIIIAIIAAIAIIVAMVAAIRHLWNTNEGFRNAVTGIWNAVKDAVGRAVGGIKGFIDGAIDKVKALWDWFQRLRDSAGRVLDAINPFGAAGGYSPVAPVAAAYRRAPEAQAPAPAVSPRVTDEQLARALMRLLDRSSARQGLVAAK